MDQTTETTTTTQKEGFAEAARVSAENEKTEAQARRQASRPPRCFTEKMPCKLSEADIVGIAEEIEKADAEANALEDARKEQNDKFKAQIALAEQRRSELIAKVRSKTEMRDVELVETFHWQNNSVEVTRSDTGERVRSRGMTRGERQEELALPTEQPKKVDKNAPTEPPPAPDATEITDPQSALDGAAPDDDESTGKKKTTKRRRRNG